MADKVTTFKIFVGNLPDETQDEDIRKIFEEFGTVVQCECVGKKAFVHMEDDIEGKHAVGELQGRELNGNTLTIQEARNNELPRIPTVKLLVKNISSTVDARGLRNMFKRFGYVLEVEVENGEGHVCLEAIGDIRSAITEMNGFKVDEMELAVEPAPIPVAPEEVEEEEEEETQGESEWTASSPKKSKNFSPKKKGYSSWDSWSRAKQQYYESEEYRGDSYNYSGRGSQYNSPWVNPSQSPFNPQPERILRDPHARSRHSQFGGAPAGGRGGFRGHMGPRGPPPSRMLLPPPHLSVPPMGPMGGMPSRIMRSGLQPPRGHPARGGPRPHFRNDPHAESSFYRRNDHVQRNNPWEAEIEQQGFEEEVFYEDDPISLISRSRNQSKRGTGANSIPLGGMGPGSSRGTFPQRNGNGNAWGAGSRRGGGGGGRGRGRGPKFTAVTEDVAPGEKYPVPPVYNPGFQAPMKRPKEEVRRKIKKKKKPLIAAELPDYSVPVPQLPSLAVPRGAVLKPFPPPQGQSLIDSDTFGGSGSTNFYEQNDNQNEGSSSHMDFTTDDVV